MTPGEPFRHEALLYADLDDFTGRTVPVIEGALNGDEPILVAVDLAKIDLLRDHLGSGSAAVLWTDVREIGRNPARIIPIWRRFLAAHGSGGRIWGVGEPVWAGRSRAALEEAQLHEELLNVAFAGATGFTLLCPYDTGGLAPDVIREAHRSHPHVGGEPWTCPDPQAASTPFDPEPAPALTVAELIVDDPSPARLVSFLQASPAALDAGRTVDLAIAIAAVVTYLRGGDGPSHLRVWPEMGGAVAEIDGLAGVADALAGREWPPPCDGVARGLWLANQFCDLVRVRGLGSGTTVRLHLGRAAPTS